jgi:hypothetical protein
MARDNRGVIPAQAEIQVFLDPRFRGGDRVLAVTLGALLAAPRGFGHGTEGRPYARRSLQTPCTQKPGWSVAGRGGQVYIIGRSGIENENRGYHLGDASVLAMDAMSNKSDRARGRCSCSC